MTEAAQRAGIEINLQIAGINELENVHDKVNSLINVLPRLKESLNGLNINLGIDAQFKQAVGMIAQMTSGINKLVDDQHQQTQAVKETNSSLKEIIGIEEKISSSQTKQTDAIRTTNVQIKETRAAINDIKNNQNGFSNSVKNSSNQANKLKDVFGTIKEKVNMKPALDKNVSSIKRLNSASEETHKKFSSIKEVATGTFAGSMISTAIMGITNNLTAQAKAGYEDAKAAETFQDKFKNMGASITETNQLGSSVKLIKENSNISGSAVVALTQKFYGMTGSVQKTQELTKGVGSLSDALHLNGTQSDAFASGLSRIESSGKVTSLSLGRLEKQAPGLSSAMAKAAGMSQKSFNDLVNSGKMTSSQFNGILSKAGSQFNTNSKKFNTTADGSLHHLQTSFVDTRKSLMKPLVSVSTTGLNSLSKVLDNKQTQSAAARLGSAIGQVANACSKVVAIMSGSIGHIVSIIGSVTKITVLLASGIWDTFVSIGKAIANVFESIFGKSKKSIDPLGFVAKGLKAIASNKTAVKTVGAVIGGMVAPILAVKGAMVAYTTAAKILTGIQLALNIVMSANPFVIIGLAIAGVVAGLVELYKHSKTARDIMNSIGKVIKNVFTGVISFFKNNWKQIGLFMINPFVGIAALLYKNVKPFRDFVNTVSKTIGSGFNAIGKFFGSFFSSTGKLFNSSLKFISGVWNGTWNGIFSFGKGIWNGIAKVFNGFVGGIKSIWNHVTGFVGRMWSGMWNKVIGSAKSAVYTIKKVVAQIANGVIRPIDSMLGKLKDGINWILDKVGAHKIGGFHIPLVSYANGTKDTHQGGLAMVNDAPGNNFREMYQLPSGQVGIFPNKRNMIIPLPKGTSVLNGERSASIVKMMGLPAYKNGIGDFFGGLWNGAKDVFSDVENILKNPAEFMESTFSHFLGGFSSNIKLASSIITSFPKKLASESINWVKKQFAALANPGGAGVARWRPYIVRAFKQLGVAPANWKIAKLLRQIKTESGGNPNIMQHVHDVNSGGNEARGLLQFAGSTWAADALPGHTDWRNGFNQILAAIHVLERGGEGGWGNVGKGHGWENGGKVFQHGLYEVAEHNNPEMIIPLSASKRSRAYQLLSEVMDQFSSDSGSMGNILTGTSLFPSENEIKTLNSKFDRLLSLVTELIGVSTDQVQAIKDQGSLDMQQVYRKQARDMRMRQTGLGGA